MHGSQSRADARNAQRDTWESMKRLRSFLSRRPAAFVAYQALWFANSERPGEMTITYGWLGDECGCLDRRTAAGWIKNLAADGLVEIMEHDARSGQVRLYLLDHRELGMPRRVAVDPQQALFEIELESVSESTDTLRMPSAAVAPPSNERTRAGDFAQSPPRAETPARSDLDRRDDANSLGGQQVASEVFLRGENRRAIRDHGTIEGSKVNQTIAPIEQPGSHRPWGRGGLCAETPAPDPAGGEPLLAHLDRRRQAERDRVAADAPQPIAASVAQSILRLADSLDRATSPHEQKQRLVNFIATRIADPQLAPSIVAGFAENVLVDGLPFDVVAKVCDELDAAAAAGKVRHSRGQWFQGAMRRRLADYRLEQRGMRRRPRAP